MRLSEIIGTSGVFGPTSILEGQTENTLQEVLRSVLIPLKSQKVDKITISQLLDNVRQNPQLAGIDFDDKYIIDILGKSKAVSKIQADPENNGEMTVYLDFPVGDRQIDQKQAEREKEDIRRSAVKNIKDKLK